jgi:hypothetical protein
MAGMAVMFRRPGDAVQLGVAPQLASWDRAGSPGQVRLAGFLDHVEAVAGPVLAATSGRVAVELTVGLPDHLPLAGGGRDLDNYLFPLAQRLGPQRVAAAFGRKTHGASWLAVGPAETETTMPAPLFSTRMTGSYERPAWKHELHDRLSQAQVAAISPGPAGLEISLATAPGRNWAALWKPLIDAFGPVLGEDPLRPFHPNDDRIVRLGLHHQISTGIGHDVHIDAWWASQ